VDRPLVKIGKMDILTRRVGTRYPLLRCVAVCCSVGQHGAVCCSMLKCVAVCCSVLQCITDRYSD